MLKPVTTLLIVLGVLTTAAYSQPWSAFLDASRAIDWSGAGTTIPTYTTNCATQPTLTANDVTATATNKTQIENALASCDSTHNVVNIPAGTYYVAGIGPSGKNNVVIRGAGPNSTYVYITQGTGCSGNVGSVCLGGNWINTGFASYQPGGSNSCDWTGTNGASGTYTQGATNLLFQGCGSAISSLAAGAQIILDQLNDAAPNSGMFICDLYPTCAGEGGSSGRLNSGETYYRSQMQVATVVSVTANGGSPATWTVVTSDPVYFPNIRTAQNPGAYWDSFVRYNGLENITVDQGVQVLSVASSTPFHVGKYVTGVTSATTAYISSVDPGYVTTVSVQGDGFIGGETMNETNTRGGASNGNTTTIGTLQTDYSNVPINIQLCYGCWVSNVRSMYGMRSHVYVDRATHSVVRDSYFYAAKTTNSQSYAIEFEGGSQNLIENNIFQQTTVPIMFGQGTGNVLGYNYTIDNIFGGPAGPYMIASYSNHNAANEYNLWEGNNMNGINGDMIHGSTGLNTLFRNQFVGWQKGKTATTTPVSVGTFNRAYNIIGNVLGQPGYHTLYESYATSSGTSGSGVNGGQTNVDHSVFALGWSGQSGNGGCQTPGPGCDSLVRSTLMRWGNWDSVTAATKWDSTEASPGVATYVPANFNSSHFASLAHTLPASLYYASKPSWWPSAKAWPPIGPDVSVGNLGTCNGGTYDLVQATTAGQCTGGTLTSASSAYSSHVTTIPAQDCFLTTMAGPTDGSGSVLSFDAAACYAAASGGNSRKHLGGKAKLSGASRIQ
jgi:hypothetical protein